MAKKMREREKKNLGVLHQSPKEEKKNRFPKLIRYRSPVS